MNCVRKVGVGVGLISFLAWLGISLKSLVSPEEKSLLVEVFTNRNLVNFMMVFNCLGCLAWTYGVAKTTFKNGNQFLMISAVWLGINLVFLLLLVSEMIFLSDKFSIDYPNTFAAVFLSIILYVILVMTTYSVFKSLDDDDGLRTRSYAAELGNPYQPRMYVKKTNQNKKHRSNYRDNRSRLRNNDVDYENFMPDNGTDEPGALFADSESDDPKFDDPNPHRNSVDNHEVSHTGHSHHNVDSHMTSSNHGHGVNDWPSHHSDAHETHHTPSYSTHHDAHASSHFTHTSSHDTHTSSHDTHNTSHDTNTATDYGSCDTGGGDTGGGDCGGGDD